MTFASRHRLLKWNLKFHLNENIVWYCSRRILYQQFEFLWLRMNESQHFAFFLKSFRQILESTKSLLRFKCDCLKYTSDHLYDSLNILLFISSRSMRPFGFYNIDKLLKNRAFCTEFCHFSVCVVRACHRQAVVAACLLARFSFCRCRSFSQTLRLLFRANTNFVLGSCSLDVNVVLTV